MMCRDQSLSQEGLAQTRQLSVQLTFWEVGPKSYVKYLSLVCFKLTCCLLAFMVERGVALISSGGVY